jgi:hypothetical protein
MLEVQLDIAPMLPSAKYLDRHRLEVWFHVSLHLFNSLFNFTTSYTNVVEDLSIRNNF